jgi:hypothetical protein
VVAPIPDHAFFEQAVFKGEIRDQFLQITGFLPKIFHFTGGRSGSCVSPARRFLPASRNSFDQL